MEPSASPDFTTTDRPRSTFVFLKLIGATVGLRVEAEEEHSGLDVSEHGESAYNE